MPQRDWILTPEHPALDALCEVLAARAGDVDRLGQWPQAQLDLCGRSGVHAWFVDSHWGGLGWSDADLVQGYLRLSTACLTTTFILTQRSGALRRIAGSQNRALADRLLPELVSGSCFATVGISHLTTSRRHLAAPALEAEQSSAGFRLNGYSPWVTGASQAETIVVGATLADDTQVLLAVPTRLAGVAPQPAHALVALAASQTGAVRFDDVRVPGEFLLAGPRSQVLATGSGAGTGGLQTSTLAAGLSGAAIDFLERQAEVRPDLLSATGELRGEQRQLVDDLLAAASGAGTCTADNLRWRANRLVLRATQAALVAAKGSGFVVGHPAARWCREALFFLVWSCPQEVLSAHLCELAGLGD